MLPLKSSSSKKDQGEINNHFLHDLGNNPSWSLLGMKWKKKSLSLPCDFMHALLALTMREKA